MRIRAALLVVGVAAVLGTLVGAFVLPDRGIAPSGDPVSTSATTSPLPASQSPSSRSSASPTANGGPTARATDPGAVDDANMLTTADFGALGLTVTQQPSDVRLELAGCDRKETLDDIASSGPPVQRSWASGGLMAYQQAIAARDPEEATSVAERVLSKLKTCQKVPPPHWLYGTAHTDRLGPSIAATWLGEIDGTLNTTGIAPPEEKINGGIAVLRNGSHVAVFTITWCASAGDAGACEVAPKGANAQLAALSRAGALRLG